jgi:hypothetical protein
MTNANACEKPLWPDGKSANGGVTNELSWYGRHWEPSTSPAHDDTD